MCQCVCVSVCVCVFTYTKQSIDIVCARVCIYIPTLSLALSRSRARARALSAGAMLLRMGLKIQKPENLVVAYKAFANSEGFVDIWNFTHTAEADFERVPVPGNKEKKPVSSCLCTLHMNKMYYTSGY